MVEEFHIGMGGPLHRLERKAHVERPLRLVPALLVASWLPLLFLALVRWMVTGRGEPLLGDLSVHVRLVVAVPLFVAAERLLDRACRVTVARVFEEGYVPPAQVARVRAMLGRVVAWRDAALPESILLVIALLAGAASLSGALPAGGPVHGTLDVRHDPVRLWYALISLPLFQFMLWRSLFRWALWVRVLAGLGRTPLRLLPAHADRRAGIAFLKQPALAFTSVFLLAVSSVLCAGWATQVRIHDARLQSFAPMLLAFVIAGLLFGLAPQLLLVPHLVRARISGLREYGSLVSDYANRFHERWIERSERPDLLGTSDIQSLADLGTSYRESVEQIQILLFARADWIMLIVAAATPVIGLLFLTLPAEDVVKRLLKLLGGGIA